MSRFPDYVYEDIQEAIDYLGSSNFVDCAQVKRRHIDLLRRLAYTAPLLKRDDVLIFLRSVQQSRLTNNSSEKALDAIGGSGSEPGMAE